MSKEEKQKDNINSESNIPNISFNNNGIEIKESIVKHVVTLKDSLLGQKEKLDLLNKLVEYSEKIDFKSASEILDITDFIKTLRPFLVSAIKTFRTSSLRVLRYYMKDETFIKELLKLKIHFFIARSLEKDKSSEAERMQALKLIRKIVEINCNILPYHLIHSLVSIAENSEDNFCRVCIETICEITIRCPQASAHCSGIKVLLNAILEPNFQGIQESLVLAIIFLLNDESGRKYLRPETDLGTLLAPLTDHFSTKEPSPEKEKKWYCSAKAVTIFLKTWGGLISLTSFPLGLKSIVDALRLPTTDLHDKLLDTLFDIFRLSIDKNFNPFQFRLNSQLSPEEVLSSEGDLFSRKKRHNLIFNYLSALLISFIDVGLIEALVDLGSRKQIYDDDKEIGPISTKATLLLGELLFMSNTLLPSSQCARVQTLPVLLKYAASLNLEPVLRSRSSTMILNLHQYHHLKHTTSFYDFHLSLIVTGANKHKQLNMKGKDRRLDHIREVKMKLDLAIDVEQLKIKIQETGIEKNQAKHYTNWKWDLISDIVEGPFSNPNLVIYAIQKTKFVKRLLSFFRPSKQLFSHIPWKPENLLYVQVACRLLEVLTSSDNGKDLLFQHKLLGEIAEQLKFELDNKDPNDPKRLLTAERVLKTMAKEYFTMIGTLSSSQRGIEVLNKWNIFQHIIPLSNTAASGRDDLCHMIMSSLDYNIPGDSRAILKLALTSSATPVRFLATRHLRVLFRVGVKDFASWGIELLVNQLKDSDQKISRLALQILDEACDEVVYMESLISHKPSFLESMGPLGKTLWFRLASLERGFAYLSELNFIDKQVQYWKTEGYVKYVLDLETNLAEAFFPSAQKRTDSDQNDPKSVFLPPHFYGELAKTNGGCEILKNEIVSSLMQSINGDHIKPIEHRAVLWALGHIGSSPGGYALLEKEDFLKKLFTLATSPCLSIRGTCFFVLGMVSKVKGDTLRDSFDWDSPPPNPNVFISLPRNGTQNLFFKIPPYEYVGSLANSNVIGTISDSDEICNEILTTVTHMSNFISAESASRTLKRIKAQHPTKFTPHLLYKVFKLLGTYKFRLPVRRFIYDLFDISFTSEIWKQFDEITA